MANHLVAEKSPYLQQHAHNPVDWYPWGTEAFEKARRENKPIFLSVGYSTCHWCHVMERESFENDQIAEMLNRDFVSIKVDREERPDVDRIYMMYVQSATGSGGWPMSVFLTPALEPFYGGTYFAPDNRYGRPGFATVLQSIAQAWRKDRDAITASSGQVTEQMRQAAASGNDAVPVTAGTMDACYHYFRRTFDKVHGGFGGAPKFPRPSVLKFLTRYWHRSRNDEALEMVLATLRAMADGGMNDQLGGGFHRYSVDEEWFVPHFEKMLYDQAQLVVTYVEAFQISGDPFFAQVARNTLDYVLRDLTSAKGGFYSAEDADSAADAAHPKEKGEGAFYIWTAEELEAVLGAQGAEFVGFRYGVQPQGNVEHDPHGEFGGRNILSVKHTIGEAARQTGMQDTMAEGEMLRWTTMLLEKRASRPRPHLDDKVLTSWNGLMISAFAAGARVLGDERYLEAALNAANFIETHLYDAPKGELKRRYRDGEAAVGGMLEDYAFLGAGLLDLYQADFDVSHLEWAMKLTDVMRERFEDGEQGGFFTTADGAHEDLVLRLKDDYDGAEPSGNSVALMNLLRLAHVTGREPYRTAAERTMRALGGKVAAQPPAVPEMLCAYQYAAAARKEIVIAAGQDGEANQPFLEAVNGQFLPNSAVFVIDSEETREQLAKVNESFGSLRAVNGQPTAFVCENYTCQLPTTNPAQFLELLQ